MAKRFRIKALSKVKTKAEARQLAMDYQQFASDSSLSYSEVAFYGNYFYVIAKRFKLVKEFKENGII